MKLEWQVLRIFLAVFLFVGLLVNAQISTPTIQGAGNNPHSPCDKNIYKSTKGSSELVEKELNENHIATGVCIKSGKNMFDGNHSSILDNGNFGGIDDACYTVSGGGTDKVTVVRNYKN